MRPSLRTVLRSAGAAAGLRLAANAAIAARGAPRTLYLGSFSSWGKPRGKGFEIGLADPDTGRLTITGAVPGIADASFLALSPDRRTLYAVSELKPQGRLTALAIGDDPQRPALLGSEAAGGGGPTHLSVHPSGRYLLSANYTDGSVGVHRIMADGRVGAATDIARHQGNGRPARAHQILTDPSGRWVLAADLGADAVYVYGLDLGEGRLRLHQQLKLPAGAGPRHLAFHPGGRHAYILGELRSEITVAAWDAGTGRLAPVQIIGTLGDAAVKTNHPAEIQVSPDGRFVYASNRGHDSIAIFRAEEAGARLAFAGTAPTGGRGPRHFTIDPSGHWLYVANQASNSVTWLPRDAATGKLGAPAGSAQANSIAMLLFG